MKISKMTLKSTWLSLVLFFGIACQSQTATPQFDGQKAFFYLQEQCKFGPRYPGSSNHIPCRDYLVNELKKYSKNVRIQPFSAVNYMENKRAQAFNIIAEFGEGQPAIVLCAHWDSRPHADQDPNPANRTKPVPAANDGASGVAVLLELARNFKLSPPPVPVQIVLFDAEDMGRSGAENEFLQGSRFYAKNLSYNFKPKAAVLLDMVGDRQLQIYKEQNSNAAAPEIVSTIWGLAEELGISEFIPSVKYNITDDHIPLLQAGIPAIDLIDFDYPYWHTVEDTPDKCSPLSLEKVGRVLMEFVYRGY